MSEFRGITGIPGLFDNRPAELTLAELEAIRLKAGLLIAICL